jgi:SAM-dependent methyltransferase
MQKTELPDPPSMGLDEVETELIERLHALALAYQSEGEDALAAALFESERRIKVGDFEAADAAWRPVRAVLANHSDPRQQENWERIVQLFARLTPDPVKLGRALQTPPVAVVEVEVVNDTQLTQRERAELQALERRIETGLSAYIEAGKALKEIRDSGLYAEYGTFEAYCDQRWGISRSRAYQLLKAQDVVSSLSTFVDKLPEREAHVRALAEVPEAQRAEVWQTAVSSPEPVTVPKIKAIAAQIATPPTPVETAAEPDEWNPDLWETPDDVAQAIARLLYAPERDVLEPALGTGQIARALCAYAQSVERVTGVEIREDRAAIAEQNLPSKYCKVLTKDFFTLPPQKRFDVVVTNPPFSKGMAYINTSLKWLRDEGRLLFLLPIAYFQSRERAQQFVGMDCHIHRIYAFAGRIAYLKNGMPEDRRQCEDAIFDIRKGAIGGCLTLIDL